MQLYSECMYCIVEHHWSLVKDCPDEARKAAFMRDVLRTVAEADEKGIHGKQTTPFLLAKVKEITGGDSLEANIQLVFNNAKLAAQTAVAYSALS